MTFTHGIKYRKGTDALVFRSNHICLVNPWYKYININKYLPSILKQNQCFKVFEIVLLECNCLTNSHEYELAIIECPCIEQLKTYCTYCRLILAVTEQSNRLLKNSNQQTNISFSLDCFNNEIDITEVGSKQVLHAINEYETNLLTTRKLTDILQPSLLSQLFHEESSEIKV